MAENDGARYPLEELASLPSFHHPTVSPDGKAVALYYDGSGRNELHLLDADTGEHRRVSDGQVPRDARWFVRWDAAGEGVYFHLDDAGDEQNDVHRIGREGTSEPVVELDGQTVLMDVAGDWLLVGSSSGGQVNYPPLLPRRRRASVLAGRALMWTPGNQSPAIGW
jgi:Tol biopolymer transport system component